MLIVPKLEGGCSLLNEFFPLSPLGYCLHNKLFDFFFLQKFNSSDFNYCLPMFLQLLL